ncbi:MAG: DUF7146 domain-containing protein, partial [Acetobacteraceae bacterium]
MKGRHCYCFVEPANNGDFRTAVSQSTRALPGASRSRDARGTPVTAYLAARGIDIPVPSALRYAPSLRRLDGSYGPAMVARVDSIDGQFRAVHRTWLLRDAAGTWRRRDRASLGPIGGGAVHLFPPEVSGLHTLSLSTIICTMPTSVLSHKYVYIGCEGIHDSLGGRSGSWRALADLRRENWCLPKA